MGVERHYFSSDGGEIRGSVLIYNIDATFRHSGEKINMYFHNYMGPSFFTVNNGKEEDFYPGEEEKYVHLWKQFDGWWEAKGKHLY